MLNCNGTNDLHLTQSLEMCQQLCEAGMLIGRAIRCTDPRWKYEDSPQLIENMNCIPVHKKMCQHIFPLNHKCWPCKCTRRRVWGPPQIGRSILWWQRMAETRLIQPVLQLPRYWDECKCCHVVELNENTVDHQSQWDLWSNVNVCRKMSSTSTT